MRLTRLFAGNLSTGRGLIIHLSSQTVREMRGPLLVSGRHPVALFLRYSPDFCYSDRAGRTIKCPVKPPSRITMKLNWYGSDTMPNTVHGLPKAFWSEWIKTSWEETLVPYLDAPRPVCDPQEQNISRRLCYKINQALNYRSYVLIRLQSNLCSRIPGPFWQKAGLFTG